MAKNSWGESFAYDGGSEEIGDGGIFRFSYWEATFNVGVAFDLDPAEGGSSYDIVQQYDGAAPDEYLETGGVALEGANVFVPEEDQELEALGLWTYENATDVDVRVYVGLTDPDDPESGTLACEQRAQMEMGCRTLKLDSPVTLSEGESYSVVVSMSAELGDGEKASVLPLECSENAAFGDEVQIYSSEDESFVSRSEGGEDGVWVDIADVTLASGARVGNLAVKALSNSVVDSGDGATRTAAGVRAKAKARVMTRLAASRLGRTRPRSGRWPTPGPPPPRTGSPSLRPRTAPPARFPSRCWARARSRA